MEKEKTPNGIPFEYETAGSAGYIYYLIVKKGEFNKEQITEAKRWLRAEKDAIRITVEINIYKKVKGKQE